MTPQGTLLRAYATALKDYTKVKNDDAAAAVEAELEVLKNGTNSQMPRIIAGDGKTVDLLKLVDVQREQLYGKWTLSNGVLTSPADKAANVEFPFAAPGSYILTITGERESGYELRIGLVLDGRKMVAAA